MTLIAMFSIWSIFRAGELDELDDKLKSQEKELRKISTGSSLGKVFLDTVKQREKINAGKRERERESSQTSELIETFCTAERRAFIDPRSYARTASATREPTNR